MHFVQRARRAGLAVVVALAAALVPAATAAAHVTVSSPDAAPGGFGKLVFRVPNESDTASTIEVSVDLPAGRPFAFVSAGVVPGWTVAMERTTLPEPVEVEGFTISEAVTRVTWTADGDGLPPGTFTEFSLSVGRIPSDVDSIELPATQTYSDGEVVEWAEPTVEGEDEPERPAPVLDLAAAAEPGDADDDGDDGSTDTLALVLSIVALGIGVSALALAASSRPRSRSAS